LIRSPQPLLPVLALAPALALLAACAAPSPGPAASGPTASGPAACPRVALLEEGATLARHRPGSTPAPRNLEVAARLTGVEPRCAPAPRGAGLDVTLTVSATARRGPALPGATAELPYWIAVTDAADGRVLNRGTDALAVSFAAGPEATVRGEEMMVRIPGDPARAATRSILVSFQLTPAQLEANRR